MQLKNLKIKAKDNTSIKPKSGISRFNKNNFKRICNQLAKQDAVLKNIIKEYGHPPIWRRKPCFETLIHIILEQQVSLASAKAALKKLQEKIGKITPEKLCTLSDEELKVCYFSRQKIVYARHLASSVINRELNISALSTMSNDEVRTHLKKIKGIGDWTVDVYLMMALQRADIFPQGDIALITSFKETHLLLPTQTKEAIVLYTAKWKPYRTIASFILWHSYLSRRNRKY